MTKKRKKAVEIATFTKTLIQTRAFRVNSKDSLAYNDALTDDRLRKMTLDEMAGHELRGCAKGALFIGHLLMFNDTKLPPPGEFEPVFEAPRKDFGRKTADLIEAAFEGDVHDKNYYHQATKGDKAKLRRAYGFRILYRDPVTRMEEILDNVIRNKGKFVP